MDRQREPRRRLPPRQELPLFHPAPERGLSAEQAETLYRSGWDNRPAASPAKSDAQIVKENVFTFFNLIFVALAVCVLTVGEYRDALFMIVVVANTSIGVVQQLRSKRVIDRLNLLAAPTVKVLREGALTEVATERLVREDVVELSSGCQVPADGPVLSGQVQVNESLITGEADPILKNPGDRLLSGSFVVAGRCRARMDQVGADSYASRLTLAAKADGGGARSEMMDSLDRLIRVVSAALVPMGAALFFNQHMMQGLELSRAVTGTVAALVGMIPEGLYLLTSVALAVSVVRLAQNRTLIHEMKAIETLARVDVLCVDKTGTITQPEMEVRQVVALEQGADAEEIFCAFYQTAEADNDTARAMKRRFSQGSPWRAETAVPFTSTAKWSAVTFRGRGSYVVGAPDFILGEDYSRLESQVRPFQEEGCRVLLLARCAVQPRLGQKLAGKVTPVALAVLNNPVRPSAAETFAYFAEQGVAVKVISGDDPRTVSRVAAQAGVQGAERFVDAAALADGDLNRALEEYTVFGRVTPEQKRKFVRALQKGGHTVAMTGDGVNDVLALKDADCGVAMASGSEAACQVAQLVLMDSDFASMPKVVAEGRRVINNIQRSASLYLVKNIFSLCLALISLCAAFPYPFKPLQLSLVSALTIGIPSFFLALEPNHELVQGRFLPNVLRRAFPGGLANLAMAAGMEALAYVLAFPQTALSTMATVLMGTVGLCVLYYISRPLDWKRWTLLGSMAAGLVIAVSAFGTFFGLVKLEGQELLLTVLLLPLCPVAVLGMEKLVAGSAALFRRKREAK